MLVNLSIAKRSHTESKKALSDIYMEWHERIYVILIDSKGGDGLWSDGQLSKLEYLLSPGGRGRTEGIPAKRVFERLENKPEVGGPGLRQ